MSVRGLRILITGASGFIGTNLLQACCDGGAEVCNFDCAPPRCDAHRAYWRPGNLLDAPALDLLLGEFAPHQVFHLGARTDMHGQHASDYRANIDGVANLLAALSRHPPPRPTIFASSMLVCRRGYQPRGDYDYCPDSAYGESKAQGEQLVRDAAVRWVIVRPTSIWGPWFGVPFLNFFRTVRRGRYFHPARAPIWRTLGFVLNTVQQLQARMPRPGSISCWRAMRKRPCPGVPSTWGTRKWSWANGRTQSPRAGDEVACRECRSAR